MYGFIHGNIAKKELNFEKIITENFNKNEKIDELIDLVTSGNISLLNGKEIAYIIIDGDKRNPTDIAEAKGMSNKTLNYDLEAIIDEVLSANKATVDKIV